MIIEPPDENPRTQLAYSQIIPSGATRRIKKQFKFITAGKTKMKRDEEKPNVTSIGN